MPKTLDYLIFDYSEDDAGNGTWDAMASAPVQRMPDLSAEVESVLSWAARTFPGRQGSMEDGADWDFDLQAQDDAGEPLRAEFHVRSASLQIETAALGATTVTLTLSGNNAFAEAFNDAFELEG